MRERPIPGFYTAYLEFEDGTAATIIHNGYGYFLTAELFPWAPPMHRYNDADRIAFRRAIRAGNRNEESEKAEYRIGGTKDKTLREVPKEPPPWTPYSMGMVVLSCERGDVRHSKYGLSVYGDDGREEIDLRPVARFEVDFEGGVTLPALEELHAAVVLDQPVYHSGEWGRATLEATLAIIASSTERREIILERQVPMPVAYDAQFVPPHRKGARVNGKVIDADGHVIEDETIVNYLDDTEQPNRKMTGLWPTIDPAPYTPSTSAWCHRMSFGTAASRSRARRVVGVHPEGQPRVQCPVPVDGACDGKHDGAVLGRGGCASLQRLALQYVLQGRFAVM